ncbi:hypothetical protein MKX34_24120 [Paenibacillus sp. FSL R5-0636]|uniref:hypothetical protein n=1 Tax=Paenibacillus TaxID=44249 RepID=UPI00096C2ED3|nr:hypothetical protein [Paenibacillus odorifer]OMC96254.1 hypothetical protein BJP49_11170 [Paenibacillus odorifer]
MRKAELLAEQSRLLTIANELSRKHWGVDYTGTLTLVTYNWRSQWAAFHYRKSDKTMQEIRMSTVVNAERPFEDVLGSLLHELVHWRLYTLGLPCSDTDDEFIAECLRVGAPISGSTSARKAYERYLQAEKEAA